MNSKWLSGKGRCAGLGGDDDGNGDGCGEFDDDDDRARDPSISRNLGTAPSLRTEQMNSNGKWLNGKCR